MIIIVNKIPVPPFPISQISVSVNNVFTVINMSVIAIIILAGLSMGNLDNWTNVQHGGFLPYGVTGVFAG